jgi:hypothetical protein
MKALKTTVLALEVISLPKQYALSCCECKCCYYDSRNYSMSQHFQHSLQNNLHWFPSCVSLNLSLDHNLFLQSSIYLTQPHHLQFVFYMTIFKVITDSSTVQNLCWEMILTCTNPVKFPAFVQSNSLCHIHTRDFYYFSFPPKWPNSPQWTKTSMLPRLHDHTQLRYITPSRNPMDERSAQHRHLYLTTHNTHKRHTFMSPLGFEPAIPANKWLQTHALDC